MKKILILSAFGLICLSSCKKNYTCSCATSTAGILSTETFTINDTKKKAESKCDEGDASTSTFGITTTVECSLK